MSNCAFELNKRSCSALTKKQCVGCHFRKTAEELEAGRKKARERIASLSAAEREGLLTFRANRRIKGNGY